MVSDTVGDFLARIKNAISRKHKTIEVQSSKLIVGVCEILKKEGFILDYKIEKAEPQDNIIVELKYVNGVSAIREASRVSKPGVRKYYGYKEIKPVLNGLGISIFTTTSGLITGEEARKLKIGGEYLCFVY